MTKKANFYAIHGAFYYLLCSVLVILMVSGCTRDVYDPNGGEDKPNSFDFSTTSTIQLNVKYDVPEGYKVLFNVYFEDPFTTDEGGQTVLQKCHVILYIPVMRDIINELFVKMSRLITQYDNFKRFIPFKYRRFILYIAIFTVIIYTMSELN